MYIYIYIYIYYITIINTVDVTRISQTWIRRFSQHFWKFRLVVSGRLGHLDAGPRVEGHPSVSPSSGAWLPIVWGLTGFRGYNNPFFLIMTGHPV